MKVANLKLQEQVGQQDAIKAVLNTVWGKGLLKEDDKGNYVAVEDPEEQQARRESFENESKSKMQQEHAAAVNTLQKLGQ